MYVLYMHLKEELHSIFTEQIRLIKTLGKVTELGSERASSAHNILGFVSCLIIYLLIHKIIDKDLCLLKH